MVIKYKVATANGLLSQNRASVRLVYVDATKGWLFYNESNVTNLQKHISVERHSHYIR